MTVTNEDSFLRLNINTKSFPLTCRHPGRLDCHLMKLRTFCGIFGLERVRCPLSLHSSNLCGTSCLTYSRCLSVARRFAQDECNNWTEVGSLFFFFNKAFGANQSAPQGRWCPSLFLPCLSQPQSVKSI